MAPRTRKSAASPGLTEERVLKAALAQIDRSGVAAFSLRDVARALGVYPTAVYWYVKGRGELEGRVVAYALRDIAPPPASLDWREWLRALFRRYRTAVQRHPNIAPLIGAQLRSNDGMDAELIERVLAVLTAAGFDEETLVDAYNVVIAALVGFITQELAALPDRHPGKWADAHRQRISTLDAVAYPVLARHLARMANKAFIVRWSNGVEVPLDSSFELFVDVVILGLEQRLKRAGGKAAARSGRRRARA